MSWILKHPGALLAASLLLLALGAAGLLAWWVIRPIDVRVPDRLPDGFPEAGFSHASFERLLTRFVDAQGRVDYAGWVADAAARERLARYLAALARFSPDSAPARFPDEAERLAYWLNAYNACVIEGVLRNWPLKSVKEVEAPLSAVGGLAFFAKLRFRFGGAWMSLHVLEQELIRERFTDPRIHFVLNCASGGCPVLRPQLPEGPELEPYLARAAAEFVADDHNVRIDPETQTLHLSAIFDWYRDDFLAELARRGLPPAERTLPTYLHLVATGARREALEQARGYTVQFLDYDWGINAQASE